jgi:hypothetical protein
MASQQRVFTSDHLLRMRIDEWVDNELEQMVEEMAAAAIASVDRKERTKKCAELQRQLHN